MVACHNVVYRYIIYLRFSAIKHTYMKVTRSTRHYRSEKYTKYKNRHGSQSHSLAHTVVFTKIIISRAIRTCVERFHFMWQPKAG